MGNLCTKDEGEQSTAPVAVAVKPQHQNAEPAAGGTRVLPDPDSKSVLGRWEVRVQIASIPWLFAIASLTMSRLWPKQQDIREHYIFDKVLGRGQFGVTRLVVHRVTGERSACKSISKRK